MWLKGNLCKLWQHAQTRATISTQSKKVLPNKRVDSVIALAKDGLYSKACQMYLDDGVVAGSSTEVCRVLAILEERGHSLWDYMSKLINVKFFVTAT